ncbi:hypothetical protein IFM89_021823 [Coptis chinensis]|uniref:Uncharacterized protein n=1 Tax=Coptis chinensis TaxID=261450 RepID=A0A835I510_9MAGN|nr:hypothetical protein IFM89_018451 [Coptis chinensis]KAF9610262.1 hypothetical protein IFM89_021823 [Coptis chinensis]
MLAFSKLRSLCSHPPTSFIFSLSSTPLPKVLTSINVSSSPLFYPKDSTQLFKRCGCNDAEISKIFLRQPSLLKANVTILGSKLDILLGLGLTSSDLVKMINCRPRFLNSKISCDFDNRIDFLQSLFGSKEGLLKAIVRNPSLLVYNLEKDIKRCVSSYEGLGISRKDLVPLLISRPMLIPRTSFNGEKLEYIHKTGLSNNSKMYKHIVTLIAISRLETIREKVANLEKFGFSCDQVMVLFGRSPLLLTLSGDKVQRNMTFVIGTLNLPATVVLQYPFLLLFNLESVLRPRFVVAEKIRTMCLHPQVKGLDLFRAFRMTEPRFFKAFITGQSKDVTAELMKLYTKAKDIKILAESSRTSPYKGFPF